MCSGNQCSSLKNSIYGCGDFEINYRNQVFAVRHSGNEVNPDSHFHCVHIVPIAAAINGRI